MSEHKEDHAQSPDSEPDSNPPVEADEAGQHAEAQDAPESSQNARSGRGVAFIAWLALLLAVAAGGLAGWQWRLANSSDEPGGFVSRIDDQAGAIDSQAQRINQLGQDVESVGTRLDQMGQRVESVDTRLDELGQRVGSVDTRLDELAGQIAEQTGSRDFDPDALGRRVRSLAESNAEFRQQVNSLSQRLDGTVSNLESRFEQAGADRSDRIEDTLADARFRLGLIEVAGLLRLGQARAELAADPVGAVAAFRQAQSRLETIEDGRLERLRQLVARELETLNSVDTTDWSALSGQLSALEADSAQWPLAGSGEPDGGESPTAEAKDTEEGWWSSLKSSLDGLVRVTPRQAAPLTPAAVESVRERLRLHLAAAQAAVARRNTDELGHQLDIVGGLLRMHFDTSADAVSRALDTISEAAATETLSLPDLGAALAEAERRMATS